MSLDKNKIEQIFNQAVEEGRQQKIEDKKTPPKLEFFHPQDPSLESIWTPVCKKFSPFSFDVKVKELGSAVCVLNNRRSHSIEIKESEDRDGTFHIKNDGKETVRNASANQVVTALGKFHGRYER